jgi:hypothetical protein
MEAIPVKMSAASTTPNSQEIEIGNPAYVVVVLFSTL